MFGIRRFVHICTNLGLSVKNSALCSQAYSSHGSSLPVLSNEKGEDSFCQGIIDKVNAQINYHNHGRLFAAVYLKGFQHLITQEDLLVVRHNWEVDIGDVIRLEKVLMVGSKDFSIIGRPLLHRDLVKVEATVLEKTLSNTKIYFYFKRRKHSRYKRFFRTLYTVLRINNIELLHNLDELPEIEGIEERLF